MSAIFKCGTPGCPTMVNGVYCFSCRSSRYESARAAVDERRERMRELWRTNRAGMLSALKAGRAPAEEGQ